MLDILQLYGDLQAWATFSSPSKGRLRVIFGLWRLPERSLLYLNERTSPGCFGIFSKVLIAEARLYPYPTKAT
jgi:hypothetical protein